MMEAVGCSEISVHLLLDHKASQPRRRNPHRHHGVILSCFYAAKFHFSPPAFGRNSNKKAAKYPVIM